MTLEAESALAGNVLPPLSTADKRALIEAELRKDPNRSSHAIARAVGHGIDHKTVAAHRERLGIATPLGNSPPSPTERREMLVEGCKDFDKLYPPGPSEVATAEESVDNANAKGAISLAPEDEADAKDGAWFIPHQARIETSMTAEGMVEIWQEDPDGGDADRIHVAVNNSVALARRILWAAGFNSIGIYAYVKGGGCVDLEDSDTPDCVRPEKPGYGPVR